MYHHQNSNNVTNDFRNIAAQQTAIVLHQVISLLPNLSAQLFLLPSSFYTFLKLRLPFLPFTKVYSPHLANVSTLMIYSSRTCTCMSV